VERQEDDALEHSLGRHSPGAARRRLDHGERGAAAGRVEPARAEAQDERVRIGRDDR
jgi:hypothetical protein